MRICFLCQEDIVAPQGGTGTYVRNMAIALAARGHDVHAIVRQRKGTLSSEQVSGVRVHRVYAPGPPVLYSALYFQQTRRKFQELHTQAPFDIIQGNLPLMSSWGLQARNLPPIVETVHCTVAEELRMIAHASVLHLNMNEILTRMLAPILRQRERWLLRRASQVIAVSNGLKRELIAQQRASRVTVIPNGIDYAHFARAAQQDPQVLRTTLGIAADQRVILYLGRLMERKRVIDLVHALPIILARVPKAHLVIVGRRNPKAILLERAVSELGLEHKVTFVDHVPYADVPAYYAMADVYALPSAYEGFPFTILEAMAAATPVVASCIAGIDEQIEHAKTGLMHPVGCVEVIAQQITRVLKDRDFAQRLVNTARPIVAQQYNWDVIGTQTEALFHDVIAARVTPAKPGFSVR